MKQDLPTLILTDRKLKERNGATNTGHDQETVINVEGSVDIKKIQLSLLKGARNSLSWNQI